jgi:hypothetical protein
MMAGTCRDKMSLVGESQMVITRKIARIPKAGPFAAGTKLVYMAADCIRCARSLHYAQRTKATATPGESCSHNDIRCWCNTDSP